MTGCCTLNRIKHELLYSSMYDLSESSVTSLSSSSVSSSAIIIEDRTTAKKLLDVEETFAPRPHLIYLVAKLIFAIWLLATMVISILEYDHTMDSGLHICHPGD